ncbi:MAG: DUF397 domain-containing protein [Pseudonocardiales bacterium]
MADPTPAAAAGAPWFTSSYCVNETDCVEVRFTGDAVLVRDSKNRAHSPTLAVTTTEWTAFLDELADRH